MRDPERVSIGRRLAIARGKSSQTVMAKLLGVDRVTLSFYETGRSSIPATVIAVYVRLGWSADWIIGGIEPPLIANRRVARHSSFW